MAETADIQKFVETLRAVYNIPGVSLAVVHQDRVVLAQGFGTEDLVLSTPVTERTRFAIGSVTKGFTAALMASLLPQYPGINWNTPLKKIWRSQKRSNPPEFCETYMTENVNFTDLLAHRTGIELGEADFGWLHSSLSRSNIASKSQHLPVLSSGFRSKLCYNNYMYTIAGHVAEILTGSRWEELIRDRFFQLLGMDGATFLNEEGPDSMSFAKPHMAIGGQPVQIGFGAFRGVESIGPAGSICCSATDMTKWMRFLLNEGKLGDLTIIPKNHLLQCWKPHQALPNGKPEWDGYAYQPQFPVTETRDTYGFGWYLGTYRGYKTVAHSGELLGFDCLVTLYPDLALGIYTGFNGPGGERAFIGNQLIHYYVADCLLGLDRWISPENIASFPEPWLPKDRYFIPRCHSVMQKHLPSTRPLVDYVGTFTHPFLGSVIITVENATLKMTHGRVGNYALHPNGEIDEFRMEGLGDLSFVHQADLFAPTDWMMVRFCSLEYSKVDALMIALYESGPVFKRSDLIMP